MRFFGKTLVDTTIAACMVQLDKHDELLAASEAVFEIRLNTVLDTLVLLINFWTIQIISFRGDLTEISAKKA